MVRARVAFTVLGVGVAASIVHAQKHSIAYRCCFNETITIPYSSFDWNPLVIVWLKRFHALFCGSLIVHAHPVTRPSIHRVHFHRTLPQFECLLG
jgi:hypothetical protein